MGVNYGAAIISEGVFHALSDEEIKQSGVTFTYDAHGHPELGKVSKAHIFSDLLERRLKELNVKTSVRPVEIGYEVRCQTPIAYDLVYCSQLGMGVYQLFSEGITGCMVYMNGEGFVSPLYLKELEDPFTHKIPPRMVNLGCDKSQAAFDYILNYITPEDYDAARTWLKHPDEFDFRRILNW
jgi:6-phosphofructokinase 1